MTFKNVDLCFIIEFRREINTQTPPCLGIQMAEICMAKEAHFLCEETRLCACESVLAGDTLQEEQLGPLHASGSASSIPGQKPCMGNQQRTASDVNKTLQVDQEAHLYAGFHLAVHTATQARAFSTFAYLPDFGVPQPHPPTVSLALPADAAALCFRHISILMSRSIGRHPANTYEMRVALL